MTKGPDVNEYDDPFHQIILEASENKYLIESYARIFPSLQRYRRYSSVLLHETKDNPLSIEMQYQHANILSAIRSRDPEAARRAMTGHITSCVNHAAFAMSAPSYSGRDKPRR